MCDELFDWAFGDDEDDLNEALLQASNEFESKITLMQQLHPWLWLHLELCLEQAPPVSACAITRSTHICIVKNTTVALQKL